MDVVQKVQNVLKSALDKPPTLTGSIPKIPEHANVEWSNILPSILSGEADAISPNGESNQLSHKITTERTEVESKHPPKKPTTSDVQTNAYAGFTNNVQGKPHHGHHAQQAAAAATEKPMIPVPVITVTEQKLSTLQSAVTESPVFQIISVIPVESVGIKGGHTDPSVTGSSAGASTATTQLSAQTQEGQTEQYVELTLSEVPEGTTLPQLTSLDMYPVSITKQTTTGNKVGQGMEGTYSMTTPGVSKETSTRGESGESADATDRISPSEASYVLVQSKNNTKASDDSGITKGSQAYDDDKIIPQANIHATRAPISHASPKPEQPSTLASVTRIKAPTVPASLHTFTVISDHYLGDGFSTVTKEPSPITSTYGENYLNPLTSEIQSPPPIEPLSTQLVDSFSSVINQVSEVKPPVLPLSSSPSNERPRVPIVNINYSQRRNASEANEAANIAISHDASKQRPVISTQTYVTVTTEIPSRGTIPELVDYSVTYRPLNAADGGSSTIGVSASSRITATASTRIGDATSNKVAAVIKNGLPTTPAGLKSTATISTGSTAPAQLEKTHVTVATFPTSQTKRPATPQSTVDRVAPFEKISTLIAPEATKTTIASIDTSLTSNKPPTTNKYFDSTLASLNLSDPVSAIDQVLSIAPLPSSIPAIEPIGLPTNASNFVASGLASGLIAGFVTGTSDVSTEKINGQTVKNTSDDRTKLTQESIGNVTKIHEEIAGPNLNEQKERNVTQFTQETLTDPARNGTLIYGTLTQTKEPNVTLQPIKLSSSNERIDGSTKAPLSSPANRFTNDGSKNGIGQSATTMRIITVNSERTTDVSTRLPGDKTTLGASNNQKKTEIKIKTTEAPVVRTDISPELSVKVANDTKNLGHAESGPKVEALDIKGSFANISSVTKGTAAIHSTTESYSSHTYNNLITVSDGTTVLNKNPTVSQSPNRITSTAGYKDKDNTQNKKVDNKNSSPASIQEHTESSIKIVTQESTDNVSGNKGDVSRPGNNTSNQNVMQTSSTINAPIKSDGNSNNTESKTASLKHSESSPKPDASPVRLQTSTPSAPVRQTSKPAAGFKPSEKFDVTKPEADVNAEDKWTLISQQNPSAMSKLPKPPKPPKPLRKPVNHQTSSSSSNSNESSHVRSPGAEAAASQQDQHQPPTQSLLSLDASQSAIGLDITIRHTSADIVNFAKLCNELAFNFWVATNKGLSTARSLALSPFGMTSLLAMIFLGARGPTSDQMNEVLGLDDVATFNPHLVFQNITDAVGLARGQGIANAAFVRELFADKMKVRKLMPFYKEQAQQFYEGLVTEVNFATISDLVRRRTNLLVRKQTGGRIKDFVKTNTVPLRSPLAALSANVFQTDCNSSLTSSAGRDGELYFAVSPAVRQRKLVPVPATTWRSSVLAGYEPSIDATAVALGGTDKLVSTIFVLPGQQGHTAPGDTLDRLEQRLVRSAFRDGAWNKLLKVLIPRHGLELQVPKFSHRSVVNATAALKRMGLDELFSGNADFKGINGVGHRLHLADVLQVNIYHLLGTLDIYD